MGEPLTLASLSSDPLPRHGDIVPDDTTARLVDAEQAVNLLAAGGNFWTYDGVTLQPVPTFSALLASGPNITLGADTMLITGGDVTLESASGTVHVSAAVGDAELASAAGDVIITAPAGVTQLQGKVNLTTGSGSTLGTVIGKVTVYDSGGSPVGSLPIYDTIT